MQALSSNQKEHLYEGGRIGVTISTGIPASPVISGDDIIGDSFSIERNWTNGSNIQIGCSDSSELIFSIDNHDGRWNDVQWEGARLTVVLDIGGEPLQAGIFTVDSPPRRLNTIQIKALDDMARFNRSYDSDLVYPASLLAILQDACSKCNVTLSTVSFLNQGYIVNEHPVEEGITYHHIIAWVAELAGANAWINHLGRLQLSWYGDNQVGELEIGPNERFSFEMADSPIQITGIVHRVGDTDYLIGSDDYALVIEQNGLLQENTALPLTNILGRVQGLVYMPFSFDILPYPNLWPGDIITNLVDPDNNIHQSVIMNHSLKLNRNSRIVAKGQTKTIEGYATGAPFTPSQKRVLENVARIEAARQTTSMEQAVLGLNELMVNSLGFYETIIEETTGAKKMYLHDKPQLENSGIIWTMTEQGFAWTDTGWNDGNPTWLYGVSSDGSLVTKLIQTVGILAEWIVVETGSGDSNLTTILQAMDGRIELKVEQTDIETAKTVLQGEINTVDTKIDTKVAELNVDISGISARVESTESSLDEKANKASLVAEINLSPEEIQLNANRIKIGMGTAFEQGQIYTWNQYLGKTWNQMNS